MFYDIDGECFREVLKEDDGSWLVSYDEPAAPRFVLSSELRDDMKTQPPKGFGKTPDEKSAALIKREELIAPLLGDKAYITDASSRTRKADEIAAESGSSRRRILNLFYKKLAGRPLLEERKHTEREKTDKEKDFAWAVDTFYYSAKKMSLRTAYDLLILSRYTDADGHLVNDYPSWYSFRHYFYRHDLHRGSRKTVSREGLSYYQRKERPLTGEERKSKKAIGSYEIDETTADIYLVSRLDRSSVIGRPYIYLAVDTASGLIAGVYVGLSHGEQAAMMCLSNAASDKVGYCKRYGIDITPDEWPSANLPGEITTDNGTEFVGARMKEIMMTYGTELETLPPFRPDQKGIVEKSFDLIQQKYKPLLRGKGVIEEDFQERWAVDYRAQAVLTLEEFTKVVIHCILYLNRSRIVDTSEYPDAVPTAAGLWKRYEEDGRSILIPIEADDLYRLSLPRKKLSITRKGISDNGLFYISKDYTEILKRHRIGEKVSVSYDPDDVSVIYLIEENRCTPVPLSEGCKRYLGASSDEYALEQEKMRASRKSFEEEELRGRMEVLKSIQDIAQNAERAEITGIDKETIKNNREREMV